VVDDGIDLEHPEFAAHASNDLHFNFATGTADGLPTLSSDNHGTAVAGLAAAAWNNERGMAGVAPEAQLASWKIFSGFSLAASDEQLMDMFQYRMDIIGVQNHSWGNSGIEQLAPTPIEELGVSNAITAGRQGRGVIMVRSGGNGREQMSDANDDAYASDPRVDHRRRRAPRRPRRQITAHPGHACWSPHPAAPTMATCSPRTDAVQPGSTPGISR
jgi:hypothetical protein